MTEDKWFKQHGRTILLCGGGGGAGIPKRNAPYEEGPLALTDSHVAALERAIRAEGYEITADPLTGEIKLQRRMQLYDSPIPAEEGRINSPYNVKD